MTDKMTDNEIITALEHCSASMDCDSCNFGISENCVGDLLKTSLDLVIRLKEANKHHEKAEEFAEKAFKLHEEETKLKEKEIEILIRKKEALRDEIAEQQSEIERLQKENEELGKVIGNAYELNCFLEATRKCVRTEAYREFAHLIKKELSYIPNLSLTGEKVIDVDDIDTFLNNLTESNE